MADKNISPGLKLALDFGPILIFFGAYLYLRDKEIVLFGETYPGLIAATGVLIPLVALATLILYRLTGSVPRMQVVTLVLLVVVGGVSFWLNDERFIKLKPTILYGAFAALLGIGLLRGRSYLQFVMEDAVPMTEAGWMILTRRVALFFLVIAAINEAVWRSFSTDFWVNFRTFGIPLLIIVFFATQAKLFQVHGTEGEES